MRSLTTSMPKGTHHLVAMSGFAIVMIAGLGFMPSVFPNWVLPTMGAFLGFFFVSDTKGFLIAGLALFATKWGLDFVPFVGMYFDGIVSELIKFVAPAMLVVSLRSIYNQLRG